jgi:hypothetical protein
VVTISTVTEVAKIIADVPGVDGVYPTLLPDKVQTDTTSTVVLVTELTGNMPAGYGSNKATRFARSAQLNIFYGLSKSGDSPDVEEAFFCALEAAGWQQIAPIEHDFDPDTQQYTAILKFQNEKERF